MITWMKKPIVFGCQMFSLRVLLSMCLIFCQFQLGVTYKILAYKKKNLEVKRIAEKFASC